MTKARLLPSKEELHALLEYKDGKLFWKVKRRGSVKFGDEAGSISNHGYRQVSINNKLYLQHRLIWIMHGNDPEDCLDHIDGDKLNNRIENLRVATVSQNAMNRKRYSNNTSGIKGVNWDKNRSRWQGRVEIKSKLYTTSYFKDKEECAKAVRELRAKLHGDFANHG